MKTEQNNTKVSDNNAKKPAPPSRRMAREPDAAPELAAAAAATGDAAPEPAAPQPASEDTPRPARSSKTDAVLALLRRPEGASPDEMIAATGWLPHSTRAALTGLRKKGHAIVRTKTDERTAYRIGDAA